MSESIYYIITTVAPVHLGADEVYEPLGFVINEDKSCLVAFDPWAFLEGLPERDRKEFLRLCNQTTVASLLELYRFYHHRRRLAWGREVAVCPGLVEHYQEVLQIRGKDRDLQTAFNRFTIHRTAYLAADQRPYLPGTAVKGALRTAYLNYLAQKNPFPTPRDRQGRWDPRALEQRFLDYRRIGEDPFRLLKVSDFLPVGEVRTRIVYAVNEKKRVSRFQARGPYQILEVIEPGARFLGTITIEELSPELRRWAAVRHFFGLEELWQAARTFFPREKQEEDKTLYELGLTAAQLPGGPQQAPLRLGRHSGAECVTIAGHRHIKILQAQGQPPKDLPHATTLWLAADYHHRNKRHQANLRPLGWVVLEKLDEAAARELLAQEEAWCRERREAEPPAPPPESPEEAPPKPPAQEVWEGATLTWDPGPETLTAVWQNKKAYLKGKAAVREVLPESLYRKVVDKRKTAVGRVVVPAEEFRIVRVEPL